VTVAVVPAAAVTLTVAPVWTTVTVYPVMALPPFDGAVHETNASWLPAVAATPVGVPGGPGIVTGLDGLETTLFPWAFVANTVNV
jgi:hypothetical protein